MASDELKGAERPDEFMRMRILVAGGAGFVGSHLCERLVKQGHEVVCVDNYLTGERSNVGHLLKCPNFEMIRHDIRNPLRVEVDQIYNLACPAAPIHYQSYPIKTFQTAVVGTMNLLELARDTRATFLQASTSEVYGDPDVHPQVETYRGNVNPIGPRACYDEGKRGGETLCFDYHRMYKLPVRVVRIFNTYGPRMHPYDGRVISNFVRQAIRGEDITIYGDGSQTRSFQYVSDLVEGMIRMMNNQENFIGPVNLGNPCEFTIRRLAEMVVDGTESGSSIVHKPIPTDDPRKRQPDISIAKEMLQDWEPKVPLEDGLRETIRYFKTIDFTSVRVPSLVHDTSILQRK